MTTTERIEVHASAAAWWGHMAWAAHYAGDAKACTQYAHKYWQLHDFSLSVWTLSDEDSQPSRAEGFEVVWEAKLRKAAKEEGYL